MYESHYQLERRPFGAAPAPDCYFPAAAIEQARQNLIRCAERAEGAGLVIGSVGVGKTLLCQVVGRHFRERRFHVALLAGARLCTRRELLQNILFELNLPYRGMEEGELRLSLIDHLEPHSSGAAGLLLMVDEAHSLPLRLLEEIRLISNLARDGQSRVRLILAGSSALEERFANPKLESFQQRIVVRCYLPPFNREDTADYVRTQVLRVGGTPDRVFTQDGLQALYNATDGIPRLVNQICDHALLLGSLHGWESINARGIEEAWSDLQQLPAPWNEKPHAKAAPQSQVVEFGSLDGEETSADQPASEFNLSFDTLHSAERRLDHLDQSVAALERLDGGLDVVQPEEDDADLAMTVEFSPRDAASTEVELVFHASADPFGFEFDQEEIVIDRYASLESEAWKGRPRVSSQEGREIAASLSALGGAKSPAASQQNPQPLAADPPVSEVVKIALTEDHGEPLELFPVAPSPPLQVHSPPAFDTAAFDTATFDTASFDTGAVEIAAFDR